MRIKPIYDASGTFMGFSALLGGEWSTPQPYKALALAAMDSGCDPICEISPFPEPAPVGNGLRVA